LGELLEGEGPAVLSGSEGDVSFGRVDLKGAHIIGLVGADDDVDVLNGS
jgi:hypothetical protein